MNRVRITLELSQTAVRLLDANVHLDSAARALLTGKDTNRKVDIRGVLAALVLAEARGELPEKIHDATPLEWRGEIVPVSGMRVVVDESKEFPATPKHDGGSK